MSRALRRMVLFSVLAFASSADALGLDANILGVFTDTSFSTPAPGIVIDPSGDSANNLLQNGQVIIISIDVSNPEADLISSLYVTLLVDGDRVDFLGAIVAPSILAGGTPSSPTSLPDFGSGGIKGNSPTTGSDVWIQALAYGGLPGSTSTGPEVAVVQLFFVVTSAQGAGPLTFDLLLTPGDAIASPSNTTFSGAAFLPEPGTGLLVGLGLMALARAPRRRSPSRAPTG